jgi:hypothetical protein
MAHVLLIIALSLQAKFLLPTAVFCVVIPYCLVHEDGRKVKTEMFIFKLLAL